MSLDNSLWDAVMACQISKARDLCSRDKANFKLSCNFHNLLHLSLRKSVQMVEIIANAFPELITASSVNNSTPLEESTSTLIRDRDAKLKILIACCEQDVIDLGMVFRATPASYQHFADFISSLGLGKEIHYDFPEGYNQMPQMHQIHDEVIGEVVGA